MIKFILEQIKLVAFLAVGVLVLAKEYVFINEEALAVLSFLIFLVSIFLFTRTYFAAAVDEMSAEIKTGFVGVYTTQATALEKAKTAYETSLYYAPALVEVLAYTLLILETAAESLGSDAVLAADKRMDFKLRSLVALYAELETTRDLQVADAFIMEYLTSEDIE